MQINSWPYHNVLFAGLQIIDRRAATFVTTFENLTMLVESLCRTGGWVCIFLNWALTMTSDLPYFSQSISQAWYYDCELNPIPDIAAFAWPVRLVFRYCIFSVSLIGFWWTTTSKRSDHPGHSSGSPETQSVLVLASRWHHCLVLVGKWYGEWCDSLCSCFCSRQTCFEGC